jgi:bidirectional [NiFe] hydrogenase diaphorase subunit
VQVCPTGALFEKGKTVSEMRKSRGFLKYIVTAREKGEWVR